jgi:DNA-directed RNA polymerase beta' subunit
MLVSCDGVINQSLLKVQSDLFRKIEDSSGDEMNLFPSQSYEANEELKRICSASTQIITAQESKPIITITQDSLIASYLMTLKPFPLSERQFNDIMMKSTFAEDLEYIQKRKSEIEDVLREEFGVCKTCLRNKKKEVVLKKGKEYDKDITWKTMKREKVMGDKHFCNSSIYNGKGLLSMLLPNDFYYEKKNNEGSLVRIKKGVVLSGVFDKSIIGSDNYSIIQLLNKEYVRNGQSRNERENKLTLNKRIVSEYIDNMQFIPNAWMAIHGFSIGLQDCMISSKESVDSIKSALAECYTKAEGIKKNTLNPGIAEVRITNALNQGKSVGMKISKNSMKADNNLLTAIRSGAKGDYFNISQLTCSLGQQNLEGQRVHPQLNHGKRTLPHYPIEKGGKDEGKGGECEDENIMDSEREYESKGFIRNSFIHGLNPEEFFFHSMSGREGVCDTAMGTAETGYTQRKIVKICEDIQVQYDQTVRDNSKKVYQYAYGNNYYDATKTVLVDGVPQCCDISRLVKRLDESEEKDDEESEDEESNDEVCLELEEIVEVKVAKPVEKRPLKSCLKTSKKKEKEEESEDKEESEDEGDEEDKDDLTSDSEDEIPDINVEEGAEEAVDEGVEEGKNEEEDSENDLDSESEDEDKVVIETVEEEDGDQGVEVLELEDFDEAGDVNFDEDFGGFD